MSRHDPGWGILTLLSSHEVLMYQDVIDPVLRSQTPTSVVHEAVHDVPVTTYSYTFTFGEFYESAPRMFDMVRMMDGNAGADASVVLTVSLDDQWMVRYLDVNLDFHAVLKYKAESDADTPYPYRYTIDVVSTSEAATGHRPADEHRRRHHDDDHHNGTGSGGTVMAKKKKKGHGGLKFLAFVVVVTGLIFSISAGAGTETGQRILGHREAQRIENTRVTPRFAYSAAKLRITVQSMYNFKGSVVDLTSTRDVALDRASSTVSSDIGIERTSTEVAPGVEAIPYDALNAKYSEVMNKLYRFESPAEPGQAMDTLAGRAVLLRHRAR